MSNLTVEERLKTQTFSIKELKEFISSERFSKGTNYALSMALKYAMLLESQEKEIKELKEALIGMYFAYMNKDMEFPHDFEKTACKKCLSLVDPYIKAPPTEKECE